MNDILIAKWMSSHPRHVCLLWIDLSEKHAVVTLRLFEQNADDGQRASSDGVKTIIWCSIQAKTNHYTALNVDAAAMKNLPILKHGCFIQMFIPQYLIKCKKWSQSPILSLSNSAKKRARIGFLAEHYDARVKLTFDCLVIKCHPFALYSNRHWSEILS